MFAKKINNLLWVLKFWKTRAMIVIIGVSICFSGIKAANFIQINYGAIPQAGISLGYQHSIAPKQALGLLVDCKSSWTKGYQATTVYANYSYYTKENYFGWWIAPHIGVQLTDTNVYLPIIPAFGYRWITPRRFSFGFCLGVGPNIRLGKGATDAVLIGTVGVADIGYVF